MPVPCSSDLHPSSDAHRAEKSVKWDEDDDASHSISSLVEDRCCIGESDDEGLLLDDDDESIGNILHELEDEWNREHLCDSVSYFHGRRSFEAMRSRAGGISDIRIDDGETATAGAAPGVVRPASREIGSATDDGKDEESKSEAGKAIAASSSVDVKGTLAAALHSGLSPVQRRNSVKKTVVGRTA